MNARVFKRVVQLNMILLLAAACGGAAVQAANPVATSEINAGDLNILEHRFFSHGYAHDPVEKRLERLECLVFGSTREGSNSERLARLMKTVAARSQQPLAAEKEKAPLTTPKAATDAPQAKLPAGSKQYPVLNTLEWRALKQTYPAESLDQRLERLESKLFGQPAQTMAYVDRVERLKKTLGIGLTPDTSSPITATGPLPKARPHSEESEFFNGFPGMGSPPSSMPLEGLLPPSAAPNAMEQFPNGTAFSGLRQVQQLMQHMERQAAEMHRLAPQINKLGPGSWILDPKTNEWIDLNTQRRVGPDGAPKATTPGDIKPHDLPLRDVPGYADPNSI